MTEMRVSDNEIIDRLGRLEELLQDAAYDKVVSGYEGAAEFTGLSIPTLYTLVRDGKLHPHRLGRRVLFRRGDLVGFRKEKDPQRQWTVQPSPGGWKLSRKGVEVKIHSGRVESWKYGRPVGVRSSSGFADASEFLEHIESL